MSSQAWLCILLATQMKLLYKLVELEFSSYDPGHFYRKNLPKNFTVSPSTDETCYFDGSQVDGQSNMHKVSDFIYISRYMMPVLGGLVSSAWLGCTRVLQIGGAVMLLSTVLMSVSVFLGLMCTDSAIIPITWLLLPVFFGFVQPNVLLAMFCWHRKSRLCTVVTTIYYAVAAFGELISTPLLQFACIRALGDSFTLAFVAVSLAFLTLTAFLPEVREDPFELPTRQRMMKYFQVFSAIILFLTFVSDSRSQIYVSEMNYFMNETVDTIAHPWLSPDWLKCLTIEVLALPLIFLAVRSPRRLPVKFRMLSGILLKCAVDLCLIIVMSVGLASAESTITFYSLMSILDGAAELLIMVAAYDLGCLLLPDSSQCLILGVMFTVWGLANFINRGLLFIVNEINKDRSGSKPLFFVYHLIAVLMLLGCFVYHKLVTLPMAFQIIDAEPSLSPTSEQPNFDASSEQETDPERRTLLNVYNL